MDATEPNLHDTTDASVWAAEFCKRWPSALCQIPGKEGVSDGDDFEGTMIGWFANAIMAGVDSATRSEQDGRRRAESALCQKDAAMNELFKLLDANGVDYSHLIS